MIDESFVDTAVPKSPPVNASGSSGASSSVGPSVVVSTSSVAVPIAKSKGPIVTESVVSVPKAGRSRPVLVRGQGPLPPWANLERSAPVVAPKTPPKGKSLLGIEQIPPPPKGLGSFPRVPEPPKLEEGSKGSVVPVPSSVCDSGKNKSSFNTQSSRRSCFKFWSSV